MDFKNGDVLLGLYRVEGEPIQTGRTSKVWKVFHTGWQKYLAMKQPREDFLSDEDGREKIIREYKTWSEMGFNPNIVSCYYVREIDNVPHIFLDWCDGGTLETNIKDKSIYKGAVAEQQRRIASIALQTMLGIRFAHKKNVVHKDIKPSNIILTSDGAVRVTDFGSAGANEESFTLTYCLPEQIAHDSDKSVVVFKKSDVYSWALVVVEMYCGETLWDDGEEVSENIASIFEKAIVEIPPRFRDLLARCLEKNPDNRPNDDEVINEMADIFRDTLKDDVAFCHIDAEYSEENADAMNNLALCSVDIGKDIYAKNCWKKALRYQPNHIQSAYNLNTFLWKKGESKDLRKGERPTFFSRERFNDEMKAEINRCFGVKVVARIGETTPITGFIDADTSYGEIDKICFSKDGKRILMESQSDNYRKICEIETEKVLYNSAFHDELPEKIEKDFCAPKTELNGLYLEADESNKELGYCALRLKNSPRIFAEIRCNSSAIMDDYRNKFSFSPDGKMLAVPDSQNNGVIVFELPEIDEPRYFFCEFETPEKLLERKRKFAELKSRFLEYLDAADYKNAVETVNEIDALNVNFRECLYMKRLLFPVCNKSRVTPMMIDFVYPGCFHLALANNGKYFAFRQYNDFDSSFFISVARLGKGIEESGCAHAPNEDDITDFFFHSNRELYVYHRERNYIRNGEECSNVSEYLSVFDVENNIFTSTKKIAEFSGKVVGVELYGNLKYEVSEMEIFDKDLYNEKLHKNNRVPSVLRHFCEIEEFTESVIAADNTVFIAGNLNSFYAFYVDYSIEFDEEKAKTFAEKIVYDFESEITEPAKTETVEETKPAVVEEQEDEIPSEPDDSEQAEDYSNSNIRGITDSNLFLLNLAGKKAADTLAFLNGFVVENPATIFQRRARAAKEWLDKHNNTIRHSDEDVQRLIDMSDKEYDDNFSEVQRQSAFWNNKAQDNFLPVFLRSLTKGKDAAPSIDAGEYNISGFDKYNSFLLENSTVLDSVKTLDSIKLKNPDISFIEKINEAKKWINEGNGEPHKNKSIQHIIDMTDEEFAQFVRESARQAAFWHKVEKESLFTLFVRTQSAEENQAAEEAGRIAVLASRFLGLEHSSAALERRHNYIPQITAKVRDLRTALLEKVIGQDHVVHAFCEGIFNSEVLLQADTERTRPLAVFTFAGPPGVGKTFLAEQAAKLLGRPFKRFDMTEYSSHSSHHGLIGFESTWKDSAPGTLTTFVSKNPKCVLLFDEIEKAHAQVIQIFYQMLDAGIVTDKYFSTRAEGENGTPEDLKKSKVLFKDAIIIFTTNAGRSLYEGDCKDNCASVATKTLLNALETEINPLTKETFFPTAIVSRIATGYPLLFNNLKPHHLVRIIDNEFNRIRDLFQKQYRINITADEETILSLLYSEGGAVDARALRAKVELFFKNEFFKIFSTETEGLSDISEYNFKARTSNLPDKVSGLFKRNNTPEILVYSSKTFAQNCRKNLNGFLFHTTQDIDEAIEIAGERDISFAIIDITVRNRGSKKDNSRNATILSSLAASSWQDGKRLFNTLRARLPELPVYLLESSVLLDDELLSAFVRAGARGKIVEPKGDYKKFGEYLNEISLQMYMQSVASDIAAGHKILYFETAPRIKKDKVVVELRNFELRQAPAANDADDLLSESEKPKERFDDVIGAKSAKKELEFFVDFLKNPKKFAAQGHRMPKGVLLYGKPGTGKTMLAKAMAGESDVAFIATTASSFITEYHGSGPKSVRELFKKARRYAPSIVFIDEVDAIAKQRTGSDNTRSEEETLNALLTEMEGFSTDSKRPVFVLVATNYGVDGTSGIGTLDEAFMRRFDRKIKVELPDKDDRKKFLMIKLSKIAEHNVSESMLENIAARSIGLSPAILDNIVETAKRMAFDEQKVLDDKLLEEAFEVTKHGDKKDWGEEYLLRTAQHECGHALISVLGGNTPAYLTVEARGDHGGYMEYPEKTRSAPLKTRDEIIWSIRTALGGRAAEIVCYGKNGGLSTGTSGDLESATYRAQSLIVYYGMDEEFGLATMNPEVAEKSPEVRARVNQILAEQLEIAINLIEENREKFDLLCSKLLQKNRLTGEEIDEVFNDELVMN